MKIGIDIGGTHTDAVLIDSHQQIIVKAKAITTLDIAEGFSMALKQLNAAVDISAVDVSAVLVGTTHAMNAILQQEGLLRVGLLRICGQRPESLPPYLKWPQALKSAIYSGCETIGGGFECHGGVITPFCADEAKAAIGRLLRKGAQEIAIVGAFAPMNAEHENLAAELVKELTGGAMGMTLSHHVGGVGFLERENTSLLNSALKGVMAKGFEGLRQKLREHGFKCPLYITQNNGSRLSVDSAIANPMLTLSAGATNSFVGASRMHMAMDAVVVDIGGTSTDIGLVKKGFPRRSFNSSEIGGVRLNFPMPDVLSIALGGGSHVSIDGNNVAIGPKSVGKNLRQQALSFGGSQLTVTDLAVALGLLQVENACNVPIDKVMAEKALRHAIEQIDRQQRMLGKESAECPILLVGGGAALLPQAWLCSRYVVPKHADVANAYGAALAEIAGVVDTVVSLEQRDKVLEKIQADAVASALSQGACSHSVRIVDVQIMPYHYTPGKMARVTVTALGAQAL